MGKRKPQKKTLDQIQQKYGIRNVKFEQKLAQQILYQEGAVKYETEKIHYTIPESKHKYTPDFLLKNGIFIEAKGRFMLNDRKKHLYIQQQYPDIDIRFVFMNPNAPLRKGAKTTYAEWATKHGFLYSKGSIPTEWFE